MTSEEENKLRHKKYLNNNSKPRISNIIIKLMLTVVGNLILNMMIFLIKPLILQKILKTQSRYLLINYRPLIKCTQKRVYCMLHL